jgi:flagellar hook-length control protein FliK
MKVTDPPPPDSDPNVNADDVDSSENDQNDEPSAFAQVLAKKREAQDSVQSKSGKHGESDANPAAAGMVQAPATFEPSLQAAQIESKRVVAVPVDLQQLVREISVAVNAAGNQQVHIELNSNVLKGLNIRIEKQDGGMAIQFQSTSEQVAGLLIKNVEALSQGLADRGVSVADIRVAGPSDSARAQDYKGRSNPGGRWQSGGQGGRR